MGIKTMFEFISSYNFISTLAIFTYWIPLFICSCVYLFRGVGLYKNDLRSCTDEHYSPGLRLSEIFWGAVLSITPVVNVLAMLFDCMGSVFRFIGKTLNYPLVRHRPSVGEYK